MKTLRWTSHDLEGFPEDGKRYEIIDGELYVSKQPHWEHQFVCGQVYQREEAILTLTKTLMETDLLRSPLLPGFSCIVGQLFSPRFMKG